MNSSLMTIDFGKKKKILHVLVELIFHLDQTIVKIVQQETIVLEVEKFLHHGKS